MTNVQDVESHSCVTRPRMQDVGEKVSFFYMHCNLYCPLITYKVVFDYLATAALHAVVNVTFIKTLFSGNTTHQKRLF